MGDSTHRPRIDVRPRRAPRSTLLEVVLDRLPREPRVRAIRRGDTGPAVSEIQSILVGIELLDAGTDQFDQATETAVRAFQQSRGIGVDGIVGDETWQALDGARWTLGAPHLFPS